MVGNQGPGRRPPADLAHAAPGPPHAAPDPPGAVPYGTVRTGYDAAADGWDAGPGPMYEPLARALVAAAPVPLTGRVVLDLGAGTGVAGRAALAAGAHRVVGADLSEAMLLRHARKDKAAEDGAAGCPVAANAVALPFRDDCFDLVLAAFCLNHLSRLEAGLAEMRRVGAAVAASTFAPGWTHPAKEAVDEAARSFGYRPPPWYTALAPGERAADPHLLAACAAAAGFTRVQTRTIAVPTPVATPVATPAALAAWRLGLARYAPFLHALDVSSQAAVRHAAGCPRPEDAICSHITEASPTSRCSTDPRITTRSSARSSTSCRVSRVLRFASALALSGFHASTARAYNSVWTRPGTSSGSNQRIRLARASMSAHFANQPGGPDLARCARSASTSSPAPVAPAQAASTASDGTG